MSRLCSFLVAGLAVAALATLANAQVTPIGPFTGDFSDGFEVEDHPNYKCAPCFYECLPDGMFHNKAELCMEGQGQGEHITGGWGYGCSIGPHGGSRFEGNTCCGTSVITFEDPVGKFGGYWGTNNPTAPDADVVMWDADGNEIYSDTMEIPNNCTWHWHGWESSVGIKVIKITGLSGKGHIMKDDMQMSAAGGGKCSYTLKKSKAKQKCESCPKVGSEYKSEQGCEVKKDCKKSVKTTITCPNGPGKCKLKARKRKCK